MNQQSIDPVAGPTTSHRRSGSRRLAILLSVVLVVLVTLALSRWRSPIPPQQGPIPREPISANEPSVVLVVDFGDGAEKRIRAIRWREGMTVAHAMAEAAARRHGITYSQRGEGEMALLVRIDGQENEGGGREARNWIYRVNGRLADCGFAVCPLRPSDTVLWTFSRYE